MVSPRVGKIRAMLLEQYGVDFNVSYSEEANIPIVTLNPLNLLGGSNLKILVKIDWRRIEGTILFGNFDKEIVKGLQKNKFFDKETPKAYIAVIHKNGASVSLVINNITYDVNSLTSLPEIWSSFLIKISKKNVVVDKNDLDEIDNVFSLWCSRLSGLMISILPMDFEDTSKIQEDDGSPEGAKTMVTVNKYERSRLNRQACIEYYGPICIICGFDFEHEYGDIGKGYMHIHHVVPISQLGENYIVNPIRDLVPVCPNCHSMLHRKSPPLLPDQLKRLKNTK